MQNKPFFFQILPLIKSEFTLIIRDLNTLILTLNYLGANALEVYLHWLYIMYNSSNDFINNCNNLAPIFEQLGIGF
jgi:hypothetical protein